MWRLDEGCKTDIVYFELCLIIEFKYVKAFKCRYIMKNQVHLTKNDKILKFLLTVHVTETWGRIIIYWKEYWKYKQLENLVQTVRKFDLRCSWQQISDGCKKKSKLIVHKFLVLGVHINDFFT